MNHRRVLLVGLLCVSLLGVAACGNKAPDATPGGSSLNPPASNPAYGSDMPAQAPTPPNPSQPADDEDGDMSILPAPADGDFSILPAPADGDLAGTDPLLTPFKPVDETFGNWDAAGTDPVDVAKQFVLGSEPCDCEDTWAVLFEEVGDDAVVEVVLDGLHDDAVRTELYRIKLTKNDGVWTVTGAERQDTCDRGVSEDGLCV